jgi:peptidoglycan/LPS O-acetylase OafA/YrhL
VTAAADPAGSEVRGALGYRPDIDGLRAIAVGLIVLYHIGFAGLPGGYVGVDVFFVISGFLITGLLIRELDQTGTLSLREFYARRARRILPASFLVLLVTLVLCFVLFSPVGFWHAAPDIAAAAAYIPNLLFARQVVDYFHPARISPVIHYWSLGVEEQFYVIYPAFLLVAHRIAARRGPRTAAYVVLATAVSLGLSVGLTPGHPTAAFYLLPTRAWELGAGAMLAFTGRRFGGARPVLANGAGALGLALIAGSALLFQSTVEFPGLAALVPVAGAVLVIASGGASSVPWSATLLSLAPMRYIGRISYSMYLWHWPLIVFGTIALKGVIPDEAQGALAVGLTLVLAAATYRWIEDPMRHGRFVGRRPSRNLVTALAASIVIAVLALGGARLAVDRFESAAAAAPGTTADPLSGLLPSSAPGTPTPSGPPPSGGPLPSIPPTPDGPLPANLTPSLLNLHGGAPLHNPVAAACSLLAGQTVNGPCTYGDPKSATEVVLFGDSHLNQWWPALEQIMAERDWKVVILIKTSCPYEDVTTMENGGLRLECDTWRQLTLARIVADHPALVILSANHRHQAAVDGVGLEGAAGIVAIQAGESRTIATLQAAGARVVVLGDTPQVPWDPADCLSANPDHVLRCAVPTEAALDPAWLAAEQAAAEALGATFVDTAAWVCPSDPCPAVIGRYVVYSDTNHLTRPFVAALTSRLDAGIPR